MSFYTEVGYKAHISGYNGKYGKNAGCNNGAVYGANAADNYKKYLDCFVTKPISKDIRYDAFVHSKKNHMDKEGYLAEWDKRHRKEEELIEKVKAQPTPPCNYSFFYMPSCEIGTCVNQDALMGAAYELLGRNEEVDTYKVTKALRKAHKSKEEVVSAIAIDLNADRKIQIDELAAFMLYTDMIEKSKNLYHTNITGEITDEGEDMALEAISLDDKPRMYSTKDKLKEIHKDFDLENAKKDFINKKHFLYE